MIISGLDDRSLEASSCLVLVISTAEKEGICYRQHMLLGIKKKLQSVLAPRA